jgi:hypothetical protein
MRRKEFHDLAQLRAVTLDERDQPSHRAAVAGPGLLDELARVDLTHHGVPAP